ncbi:MAG: lytic transglycosylase domain-containing protein [Rhodobacteraceae bacterium]|nr:lytic transglycosylase domain-containing protein [Paracoccaceae bacterium]
MGIAVLLAAGTEVAADPDTAGLCEQAAVDAAAATGVPVSVLRAITLTETGRRAGREIRPWPWSVNMEGEGHWFDSAAAAETYAQSQADAGARSFDVGCFQINYRWHGTAFPSIAAMFAPRANALYAARFMKQLYDETGDWSLAAGVYHSRSPDLATAYRARFDGFRTAFLSADGAPGPEAPSDPVATAAVASVRRADFPLLRAGGEAVMGSLVPLTQGAPGLAIIPQG